MQLSNVLCDYLSSEAGSVLCAPMKDGCPKAADNHCNPLHVWSNTEASSGVYYNYVLVTGVFYIREWSHTHAFSARCVLEFKSSLCKN